MKQMKGIQANFLTSYVDEYMWRGNFTNKTINDVFVKICGAIHEIYSAIPGVFKHHNLFESGSGSKCSGGGSKCRGGHKCT